MTEMTEARTFSTATEVLECLAETADFVIKAPVDVDGVARALGVEVKFDPSLESDDIVGRIEFKDDRAVVTINPFENSYKPRERFTLAHELGHFVLHKSKAKRSFVDSRKSMSRTESYWDTYESQANNFAAELLMPVKLIISEAGDIIERYMKIHNVGGMPPSLFVEAMADRFEVSSKAMEYRLKNLNILRQ